MIGLHAFYTLTVALGTGWAFPIASTERGGRLSDTTLGAVPLDLDVGWQATKTLGVAALGRYAATAPTLCATASDCTSSIGHDAVVALRARFRLGAIGPVRPEVDAGPGWEWLATSLSDNGVSSTRRWNGPVLAVDARAPFALSSRWSLGPSVGLTAGGFGRGTVEAPGIASSTGGGRALHAWLTTELRAAFTF